ncbi:MAG: alpha/beta hydrolase [Deltaproteobacteria bacterium]|jgi:pimeloyl-ACP methyl ester carboxylesterase|nr:alpha/beta hydrolase [Deltaproteobacteria bacterium]
MTGQYIQIDSGEIFVRMPDRERFDKDKPTFVFIHGLGESGACFAEAAKRMPDVNIIIPDLPGYGHSRAAENNDHSTEAQAKRVLQLINILQLDKITLVGHSWGGDVGTLICKMGGDLITRYFCVEGDLHLDNVFISQVSSQAYRKLVAQEFEKWLHSEKFSEFVLGWNIPAAKNYLSSVRLCNPEVFGETATEIMKMCKTATPDGILEWGHIFAELPVQKTYCWGGRSIQTDSPVIRFLDRNNIVNRCFADSTHWIMNDEPEEFFRYIRKP